MSVAHVVAAVLLLLSSVLVTIAAVGLQRFDSVFARIHPATKAITTGVFLATAGAALRMDDPRDVARLVVVAVLQLLTAPIGAHMVGRAAYRAGTERNPRMTVDELAEADAERWTTG